MWFRSRNSCTQEGQKACPFALKHSGQQCVLSCNETCLHAYVCLHGQNPVLFAVFSIHCTYTLHVHRVSNFVLGENSMCPLPFQWQNVAASTASSRFSHCRACFIHGACLACSSIFSVLHWVSACPTTSTLRLHICEA